MAKQGSPNKNSRKSQIVESVPVPKKPPIEFSLPPPSYTFIANVKSLIGTTSFKFDQQHELRKATGDEIDFIREGICKYSPPLLPERGFYLSFWEAELPLRGKSIQILKEIDWRYHVVTGLIGHSYLTDAFDLAPVELEVGFSCFYLDSRQTGPGVAINATRFMHMTQDNLHNDSFFVDVSDREFNAIQQIYRNLQRSDNCLVNIKHLAREIGQLKGLPNHSPLRFLGYFAILESVLTHAPKPSDPYDSITRQITNKLILLNNRLRPQIDYTPFCNVTPKTVWKKMYNYRSLIAHGGAPDFTKELSLLKDAETALKLIKETAKAAIRQALSEPQLLSDLKNC